VEKDIICTSAVSAYYCLLSPLCMPRVPHEGLNTGSFRGSGEDCWDMLLRTFCSLMWRNKFWITYEKQF